MRLFATGVAVLTTGAGDEATGLTVNAVASASLEPPLMVVGVHRRSRMMPVLCRTGTFALSILSEHQGPVATAFAAADRPSGTAAARLLDGALVRLECELTEVYPAGDHYLVLGRVTAIHRGARDAGPLLFHGGGFTTVHKGASMNDIVQTDCCIAGGGPAGLLLALLVAKRGHRVTVLDRRPRLDAGGPPVAPYLHPPTLEILQTEGLLDPLLMDVQRVSGAMEYGPQGLVSTWRYADVPGCRFPHALSVPLDRLGRVLLDAVAHLPNCTLLPGTEVVALGPETMSIRGADGEGQIRARVVVASDGKFSKIRALVGIDADVFEFDRRIIQVIADRPADWPDSWIIHRRPPTYLLALPIAGNKLAVLWITDPAEYQALKAHGIEELARRVAAIEPRLAQPVTDAATTWSDADDLVHHVVRPSTWSKGNVVLHGDSAHGMHFYGGQGLNLSLQDSVPLAAAIDEALRTGGMEAIARYEAVRRPFVERFQDIQKSMPELTSTAHEAADRPFWTGELLRTITLGQTDLTPTR